MKTVKDYFNIGNSNFNNGDYEKAIDNYSKAIELEPNKPICYIERASCYRQKNDNDKALEDYSMAIKLEPNNSEYYEIRADFLRTLKEYDKAIKDYSKLIELKPEYYCYLRRGYTYYDRGEYENALSDFSEAINLDSNLHVSYEHRANSYKKLKKYDKAIEDYSKAIFLGSFREYTCIDRAECYAEIGEYEKAIADCKYVLDYYYEDLENHTLKKENEESFYDFAVEDVTNCEILYNQLQDITIRKIEITTCSRMEILSLDGFDEEKANAFIKAREEGTKWYDIEDFANSFELMPIEKKQIAGRVIFPLRQGAKLGRKIDF